MLKLISSSQINNLCDELFNELRKVNDLFTEEYVIVNNNLMEKWIKTHWLKTQKDVLMNVSFLRFPDLIKRIKKEEFDIAKQDDYFRAITIVVLNKKIDEEIINNYIYDDEKLSAVKMRDFAQEMAKFFVLYDKNRIELNDMQSSLYNEVKKELKKNSLLPYKDYVNEIKDYKIDNKVYLFCNGYLNDLELDIIKNMSETNNIIMYILTSDSDDEIGKSFLKLGNDTFNNIQKRIKDINIINIDNNKKIQTNIIVAPSKIREIEVVHSNICELLKKQDVMLSDILVVAPNIGEYASTIARVFRQDDQEFIDIPYVIKTSMKKETNISDALRVFLDIYRKQFFTRLDLYKLLSNHLIQKVRNIDDSDVSCFIDIIDGMNVYRKRPNGNSLNENDFNNAEVRMLSGKLVGTFLKDTVDFHHALSEEVIDEYRVNHLSIKKISPYGAIELNDERIVKFVEASDDINSFLSLTEENFLENIEKELSKWFSCLDINGIETNKLYRKVLDIIDYFKKMETSVPIDLLLTYLIDATEISMGTVGEAFTQGITFIDLNENQIVPSKYLFVLGFNSNNIPRKDRKSEFYSLDTLPSKLDQDKYAFYGLLINASNHIFISYLDKNLKTDEKYYESSLLEEVKRSKRLLVSSVVSKISIDEVRSYQDLYTRKEYKNKEYYLDLLSKSTIVSRDNDDEEYSYTLEDIITLSKFKHFLEEPLKAKAERLMKKKDDNISVVETEYENFGFTTLEEYNITIDIINKIYDIDDEEENSLQKYQAIKEELENELLLNNAISSKYNELEFDKIFEDAISDKRRIIDILGNEFKAKEIGEISLKCDDQEWLFKCNNVVFFHKNGNELAYAKAKVVNNTPLSKEYIELYLCALVDVALMNDDVFYNIKLFMISNDKTGKYERSFYLNSKEAIKILNDIYSSYNDYKDNKYIALDVEIKPDANDNLASFVDDVKKGFSSPWKYYEDKTMFNIEDFGYNEEGFVGEYSEAYNKHIKLMKFMGKSDSNE